MFLNADNTRLSNNVKPSTWFSTDETQGKNRLRKYKGVVGTIPIDKKDPISFTVGINVYLNEAVPDNKLLFQFGICQKDIIDSSNTLGPHKEAWSVSAVGCEGKYICLLSQHDDRVFNSNPLYDNRPRTKFSAKFKLYRQLQTTQLLVERMPDTKIVANFFGVDFALPLWPVFAVFNPKLANVSLTLVDDGSNTRFDLPTMHSRLYVSEDRQTIANVPLS